ncbi:MAG: chemotaxis protein CheX [Pseudomonadota bacterium]
MKKTLMTRIVDSTSEVMETMFYMSVEYRKNLSLGETPLGTQIPETCMLSFSGAMTGTLLLAMPAGVLEALSCSFLGAAQGDVTAAEKEGTLKEALNMITGNALSRMDPQKSHHLGIPEAAPFSRLTDLEDTMIFETSQGFFVLGVALS